MVQGYVESDVVVVFWCPWCRSPKKIPRAAHLLEAVRFSELFFGSRSGRSCAYTVELTAGPKGAVQRFVATTPELLMRKDVYSKILDIRGLGSAHSVRETPVYAVSTRPHVRSSTRARALLCRALLSAGRVLESSTATCSIAHLPEASQASSLNRNASHMDIDLGVGRHGRRTTSSLR